MHNVIDGLEDAAASSPFSKEAWDLQDEQYRAALDTIRERDAELERERMRLCACGVVAMANTRATAANARQIHEDYKSTSLSDVIRAVDAEMDLREKLAERDAEIARLKGEFVRKQCGRYADDAPGLRGECGEKHKTGKPCRDCPDRWNRRDEEARDGRVG